MALLLLGLVLFFGTHAVTMLRETRAQLIERFGPGAYKGLYTLGSGVGLVLIVWGFVQYRAAGYIPVWNPPAGMAHLTMLLMLPAMTLLAVYLLPAGRMKAAVRHPMLVMIKIWALAHLLVNGDLGSMLLFSAFLAYAVIDRISLKRRAGTGEAVSIGWNVYDGAALVLGIVLYFAVVYYLHALLFGVPVLAGR